MLTPALGLALGCDNGGSCGCGESDTGPGSDAVDVVAAPDSRDDAVEVVEPAGPMVETASGTVRGFTGEGYVAFLGIPFAAPPVGDLRWAPTEPAAAWDGVRDASEFGAVCPQGSSFDWVEVQGTDEDCLSVNVWSPEDAEGAPVMVWIHGGGFMFGTSRLESYWGHELAKKGVVVVTFNYRVGPLGFLAHPEIGTGNWGLMDQQAALRWVQENVSGFGGDADNVTLFGESAGAVSVCTQLVMTGAEGLFHRAIMESGVCGISDSLAEAEALGAQLAAALDCDGADDVAACLRAVPADDVPNALPMAKALFFGGGVKWGPSVDGVLITGQPAVQMFMGQGVRVPSIIGSNKDEGTLFIKWAGGGLDQAALEKLIANFAPGHIEEVLAAYPIEDYGSIDEAAAALLGDATFVCTARLAARVMATGGTPTWMYHFTREVDSPVFAGLGAFHTAEIPFVFGNGLTELDATLPAEDQPLVEEMQGYWTRFAAAGDPNGGEALEWPGFDMVTKSYMELDIPSSVKEDLRPDQCELWESIYMSGI